MVTDYDCWRTDEAAVDVAQVIAQLAANAANGGFKFEPDETERPITGRVADWH